jgi:hypothetical protein
MAGVLAGLAWAAAANAQPAPAKGGGEGSKITPGVLGEGSGQGLRHGMQIQVTPKGGKTVSGTLVRADKDYLYIRTRPGAVPMRVRVADRSEIRPAANQGEAQPEIQEVEIIEGDRKRITYVAPNLSPGEMARLRDIETAEEGVARAESLAAFRQEFIHNARDVVAKRAEAERQFYNYSALSSLGFFPATNITYPNFLARLSVSSPFWLGPIGGAPYYPVGPLSAIGAAAYTAVPGLETTPAVSPAAAQGTPDVLAAALAPAVAKESGPQALTAARHQLALARSHAVMEDGHIVAVSLDQAEADYKAGDRVTVTRKGGKGLTGTVVRSDTERLVLRTQDGGPPTTILWSNIEMVEPGAVAPAKNKEEE